jgi:hypothetical protein
MPVCLPRFLVRALEPLGFQPNPRFTHQRWIYLDRGDPAWAALHNIDHPYARFALAMRG